MQSAARKNGYYSVKNKKTNAILFVEYFDEDWYFPDKVRNVELAEKYYNIGELIFEKPRPVKDHELHTVIKRDPESNKKLRKSRSRGRKKGRSGRVSIDAPATSENAKYMHEFKSTQ